MSYFFKVNVLKTSGEKNTETIRYPRQEILLTFLKLHSLHHQNWPTTHEQWQFLHFSIRHPQELK